MHLFTTSGEIIKAKTRQMAVSGMRILVGSALLGGGIFHFRKFARDLFEMSHNHSTSELPSLKTSAAQNFLRMYPLTHIGFRVLLSGMQIRRMGLHWTLFFRQNLK